MMEDVLNKFNFDSEENLNFLPEDCKLQVQQSLGLACIPQLGQYGDEYQWLQPCMAMRCFPTTNQQKRNFVYNLLPQEFVEFQDKNPNHNQKNELKDVNSEFYIINYNASEICSERLKEYGDRSVLARINIAPHAYLYPSTDPKYEIKEEILTCIYTTKGKQPTYHFTNFCGIEEDS